MSCSFSDDEIKKFSEAVKNIVVLFQTDISKIIMSGDISQLENLYLSKEYIKGFRAILKSKDKSAEDIEKCIQEYRLLSENKVTKIEDKDTSNAMYSDTVKINKLNIFKTVQMIIGIILISLFLYLNKEKVP